MYKNPIYCIEDVYRIEKPSRTIHLLYRLGATTVVFLQWKDQAKIYDEKGVYAVLVYENHSTVRDEGYILVVTGTVGNRELFKLLLRTGLDNLVVQIVRINLSLLKPSRRKGIDMRKLLSS